jgi:MFS family permease
MTKSMKLKRDEGSVAIREGGETQRLAYTTAFWVVAYAILLNMMGSLLPTPLYTLYQQRWHFSTVVLTIIFTMYYVGVAVGLLAFGRLSDIVGRRRVLLASILLALLSAGGFLLAQEVSWIMIARTVFGVSVALCLGTGTAALTELHWRGDTRAAALVGSTSMIVGFCLGSLLSGLLAQYAPWPTELIYVVYIVLLLPALAGLWRVPETVVVATSLSWRPPRLSVPPAIRFPFMVASIAVTLGFAAVGLYAALAPTFLSLLLHIANRAVSGVVVALLFASSITTQLALRRVSERLAIAVGLGLLIVALLLALIALLTVSVHVFLLSAIVTGIGQGLSQRGSLGLINHVAPATQRGEVLSSYYVIGYIGTALPVLCLSLLASSIGLPGATTAFVITIDIIAIVMMATTTRLAL